MSSNRRTFLKSSFALLAAAGLRQAEASEKPRIRVGAREASYGGKLQTAARCDLDGVELGAGGPAQRLRFANPAARQEIQQECKSLGLVVSSLSMDLLNGNPLASDPSAPEWLDQTIDAARELRASSILVPFFGKGNLLSGQGPQGDLKQADVDVVVQRMKDAAPKAENAGITMGLENWLTAEQNLRILDRIGSDAIRVWYDIGNSSVARHDVPAEIRQLKGRIAVFHFKDGQHYLGEGKIKLEPIAESIGAIGYEGWIVLETSCPSHDPEADCRRNVAVVRRLIKLPARVP